MMLSSTQSRRAADRVLTRCLSSFVLTYDQFVRSNASITSFSIFGLVSKAASKPEPSSEPSIVMCASCLGMNTLSAWTIGSERIARSCLSTLMISVLRGVRPGHFSLKLGCDGCFRVGIREMRVSPNGIDLSRYGLLLEEMSAAGTPPSSRHGGIHGVFRTK